MRLGREQGKRRIKQNWKCSANASQREQVRYDTHAIMGEQLQRQKKLIRIDSHLRQRYLHRLMDGLRGIRNPPASMKTKVAGSIRSFLAESLCSYWSYGLHNR